MVSVDSVFISYLRAHKDEVEGLVRSLEAYYLDFWYDAYIRVGDFRDWTAEAIDNSRAMIVILTKDSVGNNSSGWIEREIDMARDGRIGNLI